MKKPTSNGVKILEVNGLWEKDVKISSQDSRMEIVAKLKKWVKSKKKIVIFGNK